MPSICSFEFLLECPTSFLLRLGQVIRKGKERRRYDAKCSPLIGRSGTSLNIEIVVLPNVRVLTKTQATAENFSFCTIDQKESRVPIPDRHCDFLCQLHKPSRCI